MFIFYTYFFQKNLNQNVIEEYLISLGTVKILPFKNYSRKLHHGNYIIAGTQSLITALSY